MIFDRPKPALAIGVVSGINALIAFVVILCVLPAYQPNGYFSPTDPAIEHSSIKPSYLGDTNFSQLETLLSGFNFMDRKLVLDDTTIDQFEALEMYLREYKTVEDKRRSVQLTAIFLSTNHSDFRRVKSLVSQYRELRDVLIEQDKLTLTEDKKIQRLLFSDKEIDQLFKARDRKLERYNALTPSMFDVQRQLDTSQEFPTPSNNTK